MEHPPPEQFTLARRTVIQNNDSVIIRGGSLLKMIKVRGDTIVKLGKSGNVHIGGIIGKTFGGLFEVDDQKKQLVLALDQDAAAKSFAGGEGEAMTLGDDEVAETLAQSATAAASSEAFNVSAEGPPKKDNRNLIDTHGSNQKLTHEEIERIKDDAGLRGLVGQLVQSSSTFADKTAFSQEKYIKKKARKYTVYYTVEAVTIGAYCELYQPTLTMDTRFVEEKVLRLRFDTVAQILCLANIQAESRVLLFDNGTVGLLAAAIMDRLGPDGGIVQACPGKTQPVMDVAKSMLIPAVRERWFAVAYDELPDENVQPSSLAIENLEPPPNPFKGKDGEDQRISQWVRGKEKVQQMLVVNLCDSLVIATDDEPLPIVRQMFPSLALSGKLVVYSPYLSCLSSLYAVLRDELGGILIEIRETWFRDYQVLPNRTHPMVNMSHAGGYILSATKIQRPPRHGCRVNPPAKSHRTEESS